MFYYSWELTLIALIPLPLYLIQNIKVTPIYQKRLETVWASGAESNAFSRIDYRSSNGKNP